MSLHPLRDRRAQLIEQGRAEGRAEAVEHLRAAARLHQGKVGDARRRGALNRAADAIRDQRAPGRPA